MTKLVSRDETHGLRHGVQGKILLVLDTLTFHLDRKLLVIAVAVTLDAVVREEQQDVLRQDAALLSREGVTS